MENAMLSKLFFSVTEDLIFLVKIASDGAYVLGAANQTYFKQTSIAQEAVGTPMADLLPSDAVNFVLGRFREAVEAKYRIIYEEDVIFSGVDLIMETTLYPFYDENGSPEYLLGVTRDITSKKAAERELEESRQRYRSLFYNNLNLSFALDRNGVFVELNDAVQEIHGYSRTEILGKHYSFIIAPSDRERAAAIFDDLLRGYPFNSELALTHKDGREIETHVNMSPTIVNGTITGGIGIARDVTAVKLAQNLLRDNEERYRLFIQQSPDPIIIYDHDSIIYCNQATARLVGVSKSSDAEGRSILDWIDPDFREITGHAIAFSASEKRPIPAFETRIRKADGTHVDVEVTLALVENGGHTVLQLVLRDITKRKLEEERLQRLSQLDGLTNIANRRYFDLVLDKEISRARRAGSPLSLILFDIDLFKPFNDCYGHLEGDDCLRNIASMASGLIKRPDDLLARYGGEEFVVLLPDTDLTGAVHIAEQLRLGTEGMRIPHAKSSVSPWVTISLGAATAIPSLEFKANDLIQAADRALYAAKSNGKNRVESC
jgi:diguanylate cyclase (GGDEF)-like protein/PAS domain S-box-containing protein